VLRDKNDLTLEVQIGERPEDLEAQEEGEEGYVKAGTWRGLEVEDITAQANRRFRTEEKNGVVVVGIEPESPADNAGIIAGDVILEINKKAVKNKADYEKITKELKGDALVRTARGYFLLKEKID
jgi:serine protease Do